MEKEHRARFGADIHPQYILRNIKNQIFIKGAPWEYWKCQELRLHDGLEVPLTP